MFKSLSKVSIYKVHFDADLKSVELRYFSIVYSESTLVYYIMLSLCDAHSFQNVIGDKILWIIELFGTETIIDIYVSFTKRK